MWQRVGWFAEMAIVGLSTNGSPWVGLSSRNKTDKVRHFNQQRTSRGLSVDI
jgi:hypothetical protein